MNQKQAIVLAAGLIAAIILAVFAKPQPKLERVSVQTAPGEITTVYQHPMAIWPRYALGVVIVLTGLGVYAARRRV